MQFYLLHALYLEQVMIPDTECSLIFHIIRSSLRLGAGLYLQICIGTHAHSLSHKVTQLDAGASYIFKFQVFKMHYYRQI